MTTRTGSFFGPGGLRLVITIKDADTPAMVYFKGQSATFDCTEGEGEVGGEELTTAQLKWLYTFTDDVASAYDVARAGRKEYQ